MTKRMSEKTSEKTEKWIFDIGKKALQPDPILTVSEWAENYRYLSQVASAEPGKWRNARTPYLQEIMDCLSTSSLYERVVFMKGSQIGGTEAGNNWLGYIIDKAPGPILLVMPTVDMAKDNSKTRIDQLIEESLALKNKVEIPRSREGGNTMLMKEFRGGFLGMTGANSPASLRSKPIRYLFMDEVDAYPGNVGGEGDPIELAIGRTRTFSKRKIFIVSTPKIANHSRIEKLYNESDRRKYYVPCPRCGGFQVLKWQRLKWDAGNPQGAWYECEHCDEKIYNHEKEQMLRHGEWRSEAKNYKGKTAGFHLSSLYSPVGWFSWGEMATMFVEAKNNIELLKVFVNTCLGETWEERGESPEWEKLFFRRENYEIGKIAKGGLFLTAGADIQKDRIEVQIIAWGRNKENWSVDYRIFAGDTALPNSDCWQRLDDLMNESFENENGVWTNIRCLAIDTGYNTQTVYNWCRKYPINRVMPIKGQESLAVMVGQSKAVDVIIDGRKKARALKLWHIGVSIIKTELYGWLRLEKPDAGENYPSGYCHFPEYEEEYFKQLTAEHLLIKEVKGRKTFNWEKLRERNEVLDTFVYARAAAAFLQMDRFREEHWKQLEKVMKKDMYAQFKKDTAVKKENKEAEGRIKRRIINEGIKIYKEE
jgi:phage terminase large subunit GpA-like protein